MTSGFFFVCVYKFHLLFPSITPYICSFFYFSHPSVLTFSPPQGPTRLRNWVHADQTYLCSAVSWEMMHVEIGGISIQILHTSVILHNILNIPAFSPPSYSNCFLYSFCRTFITDSNLLRQIFWCSVQCIQSLLWSCDWLFIPSCSV